MSNLKLTVFGLLSAMLVLQGCGNSSDDESGLAKLSEGSAANVAGTSSTTVGSTGGSGSTFATGGKTSVAGTSSIAGTSATTGGESSVGSTSATGGSGSTFSTGGSSAVGTTSATGGSSAATGGSNSTGSSNATGGKTASTGGNPGTGGSTVIISASGSTTGTGGATNTACRIINQSCSTTSDCCTTGAIALWCNGGTCQAQLVQATGGASSTGGSSATTGGNPGTGGSNATGGTSSGSTTSTGGSNATGGSSAVTGTGGSATCVAAARPAVTTTVSNPLNCTLLTQNTTFPHADYNVTYGVTGTSQNDLHVAALSYATTAGQSTVLHWNGSTWVKPTLPTDSEDTSWLVTVVTDANGNTWAGGNAQCAGCSQKPRVVKISNDVGVDVSNGLPTWGTVRTLLNVSGQMYALVNGPSQSVLVLDAQNQWQDISAQIPTGCTAWKLWGTSSTDLFVTGFCPDDAGNPKNGLLVHFDGCAWNQAQLPSDIIQLSGIDGMNGYVTVVGYSYNYGYRAVRFTSHDAITWTRADGFYNQIDNSILMIKNGAAVSGGSNVTSKGMTNDGDARLTLESQSTWGNSAQVDATSMSISGFYAAGSVVFISAYDGGGTQQARLYQYGSCQ